MNVRFQTPKKNRESQNCCSNQSPLKHTVYPIGSMVLVYMLTWLGYIDGIHVTIYSSTMDPMRYTFTTTAVMLPCHIPWLGAPGKMRSAKRLKRMPFWMPNFVRAHTTLDKSCAGARCFFGKIMAISWLVHLVGGWPTPLKKIFYSQLGLWHSQYMDSNIHSCSKPPTSHGYVIVIQWDDLLGLDISLHLMKIINGDLPIFNGIGWFIHLMGSVVFLSVNVTQSNDWYVHHRSHGWLYAYRKFESSNLPIAGPPIVYLPHLLAEIQ